MHPLAGGHLARGGADAECDALFDPSLLADPATADASARPALPTDATIGVHEAAMKTVSLCDASLRGALYANVVLVGGGTRLKGFPERFERELGMALERSGAPWRPKVVANEHCVQYVEVEQ